ncbi:MAG: two-component sensor histidine kinase, partial [Pseudolysinimonas sp.]
MSANVPVPWHEDGHDMSWRAKLWNGGAFRWYAGAIFGLVEQAIELVSVWTSTGTLGMKALATVVLVLLYVLYLVLPPLIWPERARVRILVILGYWAITCVLFPIVGLTTVWVWTLIAAMVAFTWIPRLPALLMVGAIVLVQLLVSAATGFPNSISFSPLITLSVGVSTVAFAQQIVQNQQLRFAQAEIARLAVNEERARLARDL